MWTLLTVTVISPHLHLISDSNPNLVHSLIFLNSNSLDRPVPFYLFHTRPVLFIFLSLLDLRCFLIIPS